MLLSSVALSHWTSHWGSGLSRWGNQQLRLQGDTLGAASSVYFKKGKALYTPHLLGDGEAASLVSGSLVRAGYWFRSSCLMSRQLFLAGPLEDLGLLNLKKLHSACSDSQFNLVFKPACCPPEPLCLGQYPPHNKALGFFVFLFFIFFFRRSTLMLWGSEGNLVLAFT